MVTLGVGVDSVALGVGSVLGEGDGSVALGVGASLGSTVGGSYARCGCR